MTCSHNTPKDAICFKCKRDERNKPVFIGYDPGKPGFGILSGLKLLNNGMNSQCKDLMDRAKLKDDNHILY